MPPQPRQPCRRAPGCVLAPLDNREIAFGGESIARHPFCVGWLGCRRRHRPPGTSGQRRASCGAVCAALSATVRASGVRRAMHPPETARRAWSEYLPSRPHPPRRRLPRPAVCARSASHRRTAAPLRTSEARPTGSVADGSPDCGRLVEPRQECAERHGREAGRPLREGKHGWRVVRHTMTGTPHTQRSA